MTMALAFSKLSSNPYTQVGACIVNKSKQVIGHGYNGIHRSFWQDQFYWYTGPKDQRYIWGTTYINSTFSFLFFIKEIENNK